MTQTLAIFYGAYRRLKASVLFYIVLGISALVAVAYAAIGFNDSGMTFLFWDIPSDTVNTQVITADTWYKLVFSEIAVKWWLSWIAVILAIISTGTIFPSWLQEGAIDLYLAKPIGRVRLFLTQYLGGLLFVAAQVAIFSLGCFLVIGFRAGTWAFSVFLAVPIVTLMFSYLFAFSTLVGVWTRSAVASILLTVVLWLLIWVVGLVNSGLIAARVTHEVWVTYLDEQIQKIEANPSLTQPAEADGDTPDPTAGPTEAGPTPPTASDEWQDPFATEEQDLERLKERRELHQRKAMENEGIRDVVVKIRAPLPRTSETIDLLTRSLVFLSDLPEMNEDDRTWQGPPGSKEAVERAIRQWERPWYEVVGRSVGFEAAMLLLAGWVFCRRDY